MDLVCVVCKFPQGLFFLFAEVAWLVCNACNRVVVQAFGEACDRVNVYLSS